MSWDSLARAEREALLATARRAIESGLRGDEPRVRAEDFAEPLRLPGASFVTLHLHRNLRGCIGSLEARQPLVVDVARNAWNAAFRDPRFAPLGHTEFVQLDVHISLLSAPEPLEFSSETDLLAKLRPGVDGLILEEGWHRGTFLPSAWEQLPEPREFLCHLKRKAGLPADYWSRSLRVQRYTATAVS